MTKINYDGTPWGIEDPAGRNRLRQRAQNMFLDKAGLLHGTHVLDLACNNGRMAYGALQAGAAHVTGVEIRESLIEDGRKNMEAVGMSDRMDFIKSDLFEYLKNSDAGHFDIIICLGFLYHTVDQISFFRECARLNPDAIIIDTSVAKNFFWFGPKRFGKPPALFLQPYENPEETRNTSDVDGSVYWPSTSYLEEMFDRINYSWSRTRYNKNTVDNWDAMNDYRKGTRASYVAHRKR